jgi:hypothetical protein
MIRFAFSLLATMTLLAGSYLSLSGHPVRTTSPTVQMGDGGDPWPDPPAPTI